MVAPGRLLSPTDICHTLNLSLNTLHVPDPVPGLMPKMNEGGGYEYC